MKRSSFLASNSSSSSSPGSDKSNKIKSKPAIDLFVPPADPWWQNTPVLDVTNEVKSDGGSHADFDTSGHSTSSDISKRLKRSSFVTSSSTEGSDDDEKNATNLEKQALHIQQPLEPTGPAKHQNILYPPTTS